MVATYSLIFIVILMPSQPTQSLDDKCFSTIWNVQSKKCTRDLGSEIPLSEYGIGANHNQKFAGEVITIFYLSKGQWPYLHSHSGIVQEFNGGIPQRGNLTAHLELFGAAINQLIPNEGYEGLAVIDFEEYIPDLNNLQKLKPDYESRSLAYAKELYPESGDGKYLKIESAKLFNNATRYFMQKTLEAGVRMRPRGKWGYYGFPYCYREIWVGGIVRRVDRRCTTTTCGFTEAQLPYSSIYLYKQNFLNQVDSGKWMRKVMAETRRIQKKLLTPPPAYLYFRFEYPNYPSAQNEAYLSAVDATISYRIAVDYGMSGMIIWASSINITKKCHTLNMYLNNIMKPIIHDANQFCRKCNTRCINGSGSRSTKCIYIDTLIDNYIPTLYQHAENSMLFLTDNETMYEEYQCQA